MANAASITAVAELAEMNEGGIFGMVSNDVIIRFNYHIMYTSIHLHSMKINLLCPAAGWHCQCAHDKGSLKMIKKTQQQESLVDATLSRDHIIRNVREYIKTKWNYTCTHSGHGHDSVKDRIIISESKRWTEASAESAMEGIGMGV